MGRMTRFLEGWRARRAEAARWKVPDFNARLYGLRVAETRATHVAFEAAVRDLVRRGR